VQLDSGSRRCRRLQLQAAASSQPEVQPVASPPIQNNKNNSNNMLDGVHVHAEETGTHRRWSRKPGRPLRL